MGPRKWESWKLKGKKGVNHGVGRWRNRRNQGKRRDGRVGLKQKKNASSSKIRAKEVKRDDEMRCVVLEEWRDKLRRIVHSSLHSFFFFFFEVGAISLVL